MKSTFEQLYTTNEDGVNVPMGINANGDEIIFKLRESGCKQHEKVQRKYQKSLSLARKNPDKEHEILCRIVAEAIIVDWKGVLNEKGKPIACTFDEKFENLKKYKKLFYEVLSQSSNEENFNEIDPEYTSDTAAKDTEKNLKKS
jgi:hypothetical protein